MHLVLPVVPWHTLVTPSAAAGVLTAAVSPEHDVSTYYANVKFAEALLAIAGTDADPDGRLDADFLTTIADDGYLPGVAEWIFTQALYREGPHDPGPIEASAARLGLDIRALRIAHDAAVPFTDLAAKEILQLAPDVVGLSTTFAQTTACLALARALKQLAPEVPVVLGGSNCDGPMGAALHRAFPFVDFVVRREGERPLRALLRALAGPADDRAATLAGIPGLCWRRGSAQQLNPEPVAFPPGGELPAIDQQPYFDALADSPLLAPYVVPRLILESSRGCWWGERKHCKFCGLSDLTIGFRAKPGSTVADELLTAASRHRVLDVMTSDNILDLSYFDDLVPQLAAADFDFNVFYELRVNLSAEQVAALARAGIRDVQPGVENLHSAPLKLMDKGTAGVMNVAALRNFTENSVHVGWNYLVGFPGETDAHYDEVIAQLPNLVHLQPPNGAHRIVLERFNPYFERPELGFSRRHPMPWYWHVYPGLPEETLNEIAYLFECEPAGISAGALARLKDGINAWKAAFEGSRLTHRAVGDELYVYDRRGNRPPADYVLTEPAEIAAYHRLERGRSPARLARDLGADGFDLDAAWAERFVQALQQRGLVFTESGQSVRLSMRHDVGRVQRPAAPTSAAMASHT